MAITLQEYQRKIRDFRVTEARPTVFRGLFVGVGGTPLVETLDNLVEEIRDTEVIPYGEMKIIGDFTGNSGVPNTTFDASRVTFYARTAAIAYAVTDHELERMDANNVPIRQLKGAANFSIAETFLENAVLLGNTQYGFGSLLKNASITPTGASTKGGGGTTWAVATHEEMVQEMLAAHFAVKNNSYSRWIGNTIGIPDSQYQRAISQVDTYTKKNAIQAAIDRSQGGITRVLPIWQLAGAGAGSTNRMICFDASRGVVQMSEKPFALWKTIETDTGWKTIEYLRTAGTIWNDIQGATYIDGI